MTSTPTSTQAPHSSPDTETKPPRVDPESAEAIADQKTARMAELNELVELMAQSVAYDGGELRLIDADLETGVVTVELSGSCSSCAISTSTLADGVTRILTERLPWVTDVIGNLDETIDPYESMAAGRGAYVPRY